MDNAVSVCVFEGLRGLNAEVGNRLEASFAAGGSHRRKGCPAVSLAGALWSKSALGLAASFGEASSVLDSAMISASV